MDNFEDKHREKNPTPKMKRQIKGRVQREKRGCGALLSEPARLPVSRKIVAFAFFPRIITTVFVLLFFVLRFFLLHPTSPSPSPLYRHLFFQSLLWKKSPS